MKRVTIRLSEPQHTVLVRLAQELGSDLSGAFRSLISAHERVQRLLDSLAADKAEILHAVDAAHEAADQARETAIEIGNKHLTNLKALADWLNSRL